MAFFTTAALIGAGGSLLGGLLGANAAEKAANTQAKSADKATALQREQWLKNLELNKPFYEAGLKGQDYLMNYLGIGGDPTTAGYGAGMKPFTGADLASEPGYAFRLSEGVNALNKKAAASGGLLSGAALKAAERYGQDYASNEYQNAYNRYWNTRNQVLNPVQSLLGQGQTTANNLGAAGMNYATRAGDTMMGAANARASGYIGGANALNSALTGTANQYMNYGLMSKLMGTPPATNPYLNPYGSAGGGLSTTGQQQLSNYGGIF